MGKRIDWFNLGIVLGTALYAVAKELYGEEELKKAFSKVSKNGMDSYQNTRRKLVRFLDNLRRRVDVGI